MDYSALVGGNPNYGNQCFKSNTVEGKEVDNKKEKKEKEEMEAS